MKKDKSWNERGNISLKDRFNYWFDNRVTKGSLGLIKALIAASVALAVLIAGLIILFRFNEEGEVGSVFWNSIATVINAWMPYFDEGSPGYLILMSVTAIAGVLYCSAYPTLSPTTGSLPGIKAFTAAVFGGIGSIPGAMLGGILLGIIEIFSNAYISTQLSDAIVFAVLIIVLLIKPTGLLGKKIREKV